MVPPAAAAASSFFGAGATWASFFLPQAGGACAKRSESACRRSLQPLSPIQNNSDLAQGPFQFAPLKSGVATSIWRQEGYMAPKPKPARFEFTVGMVLAMALTILVVMTWAVAAPSSSAIYHPQLLLLY